VTKAERAKRARCKEPGREGAGWPAVADRHQDSASQPRAWWLPARPVKPATWPEFKNTPVAADSRYAGGV